MISVYTVVHRILNDVEKSSSHVQFCMSGSQEPAAVTPTRHMLFLCAKNV